METLRVYMANKEMFVHKINNNMYATLARLNYDYGRLIGMLDILMINGTIDCKKYNKEVTFLDDISYKWMYK